MNDVFIRDVPPEMVARLKDFDGAKADLTDSSTRRFIANAIAAHVYAALGYDDPVKHKEIHDTVLWVLNELATARVRISS